MWFEPIDPETGHEVVLDAEQEKRLGERALNLCLWHLNQGPRTVHQLRSSMAKKQVPDALMDAAIARLVEFGYVDDVAYAENYVRSKHEVARKGARVIRQELRRKGVADDVVVEALAGIDEESEEANARALVERKLRSTRGLERQKRTTRLVAMLARRGYSGSMAFRVVREALDADVAADDEVGDDEE